PTTQVLGSCYASSCYGGGYDACYSSCYSSCYGGKHHGGRGLFGGLFHHKRRASACCGLGGVESCYAYSACYSSPVFGSYPPRHPAPVARLRPAIPPSSDPNSPSQTRGPRAARAPPGPPDPAPREARRAACVRPVPNLGSRIPNPLPSPPRIAFLPIRS